jgi:PIN domain
MSFSSRKTHDRNVYSLTMPADKLTPDDIWSKRITFLCIDTEVIQRAGYQFTKGALNQLPHQLPDSLHLVLTSIIEQEVMSHRTEAVDEAMAKMRAAVDAIKRASGLDVQSLNTAFNSLNLSASAHELFTKEMSEFVGRCNGVALGLEDLDGPELIADYFNQKPPFEAKKKHEFPDAATLQILKRYAEAHDTMGIIVSGDGGWEKYAATSDRLFCIKTLDELTALFVATGRTAEEVIKKVKSYLGDPMSALRVEIQDAIDRHVSGEADWDTSDFIPDIGSRMEMEITDASIEDISLRSEIEIWQDEDDNEFAWIVAVVARVEVELSGQKYLYVWDGVDREEFLLTSESETLSENIDVRFYIRLTNVRLDVDVEHWGIDVDIAPANYDLGQREIIFDMR